MTTWVPGAWARWFVRGLPIAQGSHRAFVPRSGRMAGRAVITTTAKGLAAWRQAVQASLQGNGIPSDAPWTGPVELRLTFYLPLPKSAPKRRRVYAVKRPDVDKLQRSVLDALTHVLIEDDSQVVSVHAEKHYANYALEEPEHRERPPGVMIEARLVKPDVVPKSPARLVQAVGG